MYYSKGGFRGNRSKSATTLAFFLKPDSNRKGADWEESSESEWRLGSSSAGLRYRDELVDFGCERPDHG